MYNILKTASRRAKRTKIGGKSGNRRLYIPYIGRTRVLGPDLLKCHIC